jgi:plastocyanin
MCLVGCDGATANESPAAVPRVAPTFGTATLKGVVKFIGTPPTPATIANVPCHEGATKQLKDESVVVNDNQTLANVLIYLEGIQASDGSNRAPALLDQKDCRYVPHVIAVQTGQALRIHSSDATLHNVHYNAAANPPANFAMTSAGAEQSVTFKRKEFIRVKCDVHPWMTAYIGVFDHPFFAASAAGTGQWQIDKVPAGKYTLVAWHEQLGELRQPVEVKDNETAGIELSYKAP